MFGDESCRPYRTAETGQGPFPRVSPGAIFIRSLWERGALAVGIVVSHPVRTGCGKDGAPGHWGYWSPTHFGRRVDNAKWMGHGTLTWNSRKLTYSLAGR